MILGKNLKKHLTDIYKGLAMLEFNITIAKLNNEITTERQELSGDLLKLGKEILNEIKKVDSKI